MTSPLRPLRDLVLIEPIHRPPPRNGVMVPDKYVDTPTEGMVLAKGPLVTTDLQIGQRVQFSRHEGQEVQVGGKDYRLLKVGGVVAILV